MKTFYTWTQEELGLNVQEMDAEHQELIAKMNTLFDSVEAKKPPATILSHIDALAAFTVKHFADEEAYMQKIGFEGLATHKIIHQQLLSQFTGFVDEFKAKKVLNPGFFNFLKVWLTSHIRGIDMKYASKKEGSGKAA